MSGADGNAGARAEVEASRLRPGGRPCRRLPRCYLYCRGLVIKDRPISIEGTPAWHRDVATLNELLELLADNAVVHSPVVHGKVAGLLQARRWRIGARP